MRPARTAGNSLISFRPIEMGNSQPSREPAFLAGSPERTLAPVRSVPYSGAENMARLQPRDRVGLVGTGMVGASFAYSLMQSGLANELILIDADAARAEGEAMDLSHGLPLVGPMRIREGGMSCSPAVTWW